MYALHDDIRNLSAVLDLLQAQADAASGPFCALWATTSDCWQDSWRKDLWQKFPGPRPFAHPRTASPPCRTRS